MSSENDIILNAELDIFVPNLLEGIREYLFMDFHALMNNEIFTPISLHILETALACWRRKNWGGIDELAGCFLSIRFRTVCAVNAQTWLNSNRIAAKPE